MPRVGRAVAADRRDEGPFSAKADRTPHPGRAPRFRLFRDKAARTSTRSRAPSALWPTAWRRSSRRPGLLMAYKLLEMAQARWRRLDGAHLLPLVRAGIVFWTAFSTRGRSPRREHERPDDTARSAACVLPSVLQSDGIKRSSNGSQPPRVARSRPRPFEFSVGRRSRSPSSIARWSGCARARAQNNTATAFVARIGVSWLRDEGSHHLAESRLVTPEAGTTSRLGSWLAEET
jgi:hypothetical protein